MEIHIFSPKIFKIHCTDKHNIAFQQLSGSDDLVLTSTK